MYTRDLPVEIGCTVSHNKLEYFLCVLWNFCIFFGVFWLNITKFKVNWCYRYCFKLFSNLRKEKELWQYHCRNSTKVGERKINSRREKFLIFGNGIAAIPLPILLPGWVLEMWMHARKTKWRGKNKIWQLWQCHCRNRWYKFLAIVAMALPKMGKKMLRNLWKSKKKSCHVHNIFTIFSQ